MKQSHSKIHPLTCSVHPVGESFINHLQEHCCACTLGCCADCVACVKRRVALIQGGRKALLQQTATPTSSGSDFAFRTEHAAAVDQPAADQAAPAAAQLPSLHRDALALLLDLVPLPESAYALCSSIIGQKDPLQQQPPPPGQGVGVDVFAGADASSSGSSSQRLLVLDVRRHDERTLYGSIPGTVHVPGKAGQYHVGLYGLLSEPTAETTP